MNKRQKLVQQQFLNNEEAVIKRLKQVYGQSLKDIEKKAQSLQDDINRLGTLAKLATDEAEKAQFLSMQQSKVYQKQYQDALKKQIGSVLDNMQVEEFKTVSEYLQKCYEDGFIGTMFDLHGQGIPLCFPMDQEAMVRAVQLDSKISQGLYSRLGEDVALLKKKITAQVSRGIATGMSFQQVAQQLAGYTNIGYNNAVRIARTEGHRIQVQSAMDACHKAKDKGADVVKQWDSTLDARTRDSHAAVDGEIRELDEKFSNSLMFPGDPSGGAAEVVNCRCALLQRAKWALDEDELQTLKERAEYFGLDKADTFDDYKEKYLKAAEQIEQSPAIEYRQPEKEDYSRMAKESKKAVSKEDITQISGHTKADGSPGGYVATHNYSNINSNMRIDGYAGNPLDDDDFKTIDAMRRAISSYSLDDNYTMTRYVNADYLSSVFGVKTKIWAKGNLEDITDSITRIGNPYVVKTAIPDITKQLQAHIGECITERAFVSASVLPNKNIMHDKSVLFRINAKKGTKCFVTSNRKESECIFADNSKLFITDVQFDEDARKWIFTVDIE